MNAGFYERLEALQGLRSTFYAGEIFNFSTVETVVAYARDLVARRIADGHAGAASGSPSTETATHRPHHVGHC